MQVQFSWDRNRQSEQSFNSKEPNDIVISHSIHFRPSKLKFRRIESTEKRESIGVGMSQSIQRSNGANLKPRLFEAGFTLYFCDAFWTAV